MNKIIYLLGTKLRNPSLKSQYTKLLSTDVLKIDKLEELQLYKLKKLINFAYENSSYYKSILDEKNVKPSDIYTLNDLHKLPIIDKTTLIHFCSTIQNMGFSKLRLSETSGTTGQPLKIFRSEYWDSGTRAAMFRGYSWYGVKPWDRNGYFWGYNIDRNQATKVEFLDRLQNRFRLFSYTDNEITKFCYKLRKAKYISGYSSMIYEVAKKINELGLSLQFPYLKMVKGTSEKIWPAYQEEVIKAFGLKMISEYGSMETGLIAFECPQGNMHIASENVIVEEVNGEAVITNLLSDSFPIIRYRLGDAIKLADPAFRCSCGREHPVIVDVLGRVGTSILGKRNKYPSLTFYYVFKNLTLEHNLVANYQAIQNINGAVLLKIEQKYSPELDRFIKLELKKYFDDDVDFEIMYSKTLHLMDGKLKDFIQNIV